MSFCCADLVEMFSLTDTPITVIAGHAYLHREIQWVYLAEAVDNFLDTIPWTKDDEEHRRSCHQYRQIHRRDISSRHCSR